MTDTLTALDATFLELEQSDEGALMAIGGVSVFDPVPGGGAPTFEQLCANLGARLFLDAWSRRWDIESPRAEPPYLFAVARSE